MRNVYVDAFQIVFLGVHDIDLRRRLVSYCCECRAARVICQRFLQRKRRTGDNIRFVFTQGRTGVRLGDGHDSGGRTFGDNASSVHTSFGAEIN